MSYYESKTEITGDIIGKPRCHPYGSGHVANIVVSVTKYRHTEEFKAVAFGELGSEIERSAKAGQVVRCSGYMKSSEWADGSGKVNHQLIIQEFEVVRNHLTSVPAAESKPQKKQRRQYGRHARKTQGALDFRAVTDPKIPFNDELPPL